MFIASEAACRDFTELQIQLEVESKCRVTAESFASRVSLLSSSASAFVYCCTIAWCGCLIQVLAYAEVHYCSAQNLKKQNPGLFF